MGDLGLDVRTLIFFVAVFNAAVVVLLRLYQWDKPADRPLRQYLVGALLQTAAWLLIYLRGAVPDLLSVQVGNCLLFASFGLSASALTNSVDPAKRLDAVYIAVVVLGTAAFLISSAISRDYRVAFASIGSLGPFCVLCWAALFGPARGGRRSGLRLFVGIGSGLLVAVLAARALVSFGAGSGFTLLTPSLIQNLSFLSLFVVEFLAVMSFVLLLKERDDLFSREGAEQYRRLVERASEAIVIAQDERVAFVNRRMSELLGLPEAEIVGRRFVDFLSEGDRDLVSSRFRSRVAGGRPPEVYDVRIKGAGGDRWVSVSSTVVQWKGEPATLTLLSDVTARRETERRIARLLEEKETLLREVHHRIKNNLAVATSLLALQAEECGAKDPREILLDARNRLHSFLRLYDLLQESGGLDAMPLGRFLEPLVREISGTYPVAGRVAFELEIADIVLPSAKLAPLGLIVNEMATNSLKHAFNDCADPRIRLTASEAGGKVRLVYEDSGPGLPEGFDPETGSRLGMRLIQMLSGQIGAALSVGSGRGARYVIEFESEPGRAPSDSAALNGPEEDGDALHDT